MIRLVQRSLALLFIAAPLLFMGCSSSSTSTPDAPILPIDGSTLMVDVPNAPTPDASVDNVLAPPDLGADRAPDVTADSTIAPGDVGPNLAPDVAADSIIAPGEVGPTFTPDAAADKLPAPGDLGGTGGVIGTGGDAAVDNSAAVGEAGPAATGDAAGEGHADGGTAAAEAGTPKDSSGAATDSGSVACVPFFGGYIAADTRLTKACSPYSISEYIEVNGSATLTIEPGVTLSFDGNIGIEVGNADVGTLVAVGTAQDPITFTSSSSPPLAGDWGGIRLFDGTLPGTQIAYAKVDFCGADRSGCIVGDGVSPNVVTIDHVTIDHVGPDSDGILEWDSDSNFLITNSTFSNIPEDKYAISVQASSFAGIGAGNTFNGGTMIEIGGGTIGSTASWVDRGTPVAVTGSVWLESVSGNPVLTIGAGMTLMFAATNPPVEFSVGYGGAGSLVIAGTSAKRVTLTSLAPTPDLGDWVGVEVWSAGKAQISFADISYAGSDGVSGGGDLILENGNSPADIAVDHSSFTYSRGYGIYLDCAGATVTPQSTVELNAGISYAHNESDPTNSGLPSENVGPGLTGPDCTFHHHH